MEIKKYPEAPVLIVDDEAQFLQSASFSLRSSGVNNVAKCQDSREVIGMLAKQKYSAILLDILMPHLTGRELLPEIMKNYPGIPVIMLTALTEVEIAVECMKNGAFDYMVKPVDKTRLVTSIKKAIEYSEVKSENITLTNDLQEANRELQAKTEKQAELLKELTKSTNQLKSILDSSHNVILLVDPDNKIAEVNRSTESFFGINLESVKGSSFDSFVDTILKNFKDKEKVKKVLREKAGLSIDEQMKSFYQSMDAKFRLELDKPEERIISVFSIPVSRSEDENMGTVWLFNDITSLIKSDEMLRTIVETAPTPVIITRIKDGSIVYCNEHLGRLAGYVPEEIIGMKAEEFYNDPDERDILMKMLKDEGAVRNYEVQFKNSSGEAVWTLLSLALAQLNNEPVIIGGFYDISSQKQAVLDVEEANKNLRWTQSQLVQSEKMASLGMLVAGIAHEINTPVGAIASMHDTLERAINKLEKFCLDDMHADETQQKKITTLCNTIAESNQVINSASSRVTEIVKRLRSFARLDEAELNTVDIHESLDDTLVILNHKLKHGITVEKKYGSIPEVDCYPGRINQAFLNILNNASQAIEQPGTITIETGQKDRSIYIKISDTGCGIPEEKLDKIFDPGFTTKGVGVGTGLGLSITYQIIQDHKGEITVESTVGKGTTFTIALPLDLYKVLDEGK
jgi:PAS domain S-box-containing protein